MDYPIILLNVHYHKNDPSKILSCGLENCHFLDFLLASIFLNFSLMENISYHSGLLSSLKADRENVSFM
jgi:hypothetical protein